MTTTLVCHSTRVPRVNVGNSLRFVHTDRIRKEKITIDVFFSSMCDYERLADAVVRRSPVNTTDSGLHVGCLSPFTANA